jgi:hypothetical protein
VDPSRERISQIVSIEQFEQARAIVLARNQHMTDEELLLRLRGSRGGRLVVRIHHDEQRKCFLQASTATASAASCGPTLIGYVPDRDYRHIEINRAPRQRHPEIVAEIVDGIQATGGSAVRDPATDLLDINSEFTASVAIVRCTISRADHCDGSCGWIPASFQTSRSPFEWTKTIRSHSITASLPSVDMNASRLKMAEQNALSLDIGSTLLISSMSSPPVQAS